LTFTLAAFRLMTIRQPSTFSSPFVAGHASPYFFFAATFRYLRPNSYVARPVDCVGQTLL
jgi:hypothetical protein